jgi:hypothetical protein
MSFFAFTCCSFNFDLACVINCMVVELGLLKLYCEFDDMCGILLYTLPILESPHPGR